jgi:hypothetical protein
MIFRGEEDVMLGVNIGKGDYMQKLERLIELARLKQGGEEMTVREMSQVCGVSQRTLYRYLKTLSRIDPLAGLAPQPDSRKREARKRVLSGDEANLLRYALENNPLAGYPHFVGRFRTMGRKLGLGRSRAARGEVYQFKPVIRTQVAPAADSMLDRFGKACVERRPVMIQTRGRTGRSQTVWPRGILVKSDLVCILVAATERGRSRELKLNRIDKITVCRRRSQPIGQRPGRKKG